MRESGKAILQRAQKRQTASKHTGGAWNMGKPGVPPKRRGKIEVIKAESCVVG